MYSNSVLKLSNEQVVSTGGLCTCECVTLLWSCNIITLSIHWYIAQNLYPPFYYPSFLAALLRLLSLADS